MEAEARKCSRPGCDKKLRPFNKSGTCSSGCRSSEAPAYQRAKDVEGGAPPVVRARPKKREAPGRQESYQERLKGHSEVVGRFHTVATALGKDPDALIAAFAEGWLEALRERLEEADS